MTDIMREIDRRNNMDYKVNIGALYPHLMEQKPAKAKTKVSSKLETRNQQSTSDLIRSFLYTPSIQTALDAARKAPRKINYFDAGSVIDAIVEIRSPARKVAKLSMYEEALRTQLDALDFHRIYAYSPNSYEGVIEKCEILFTAILASILNGTKPIPRNKRLDGLFPVLDPMNFVRDACRALHLQVVDRSQLVNYLYNGTIDFVTLTNRVIQSLAFKDIEQEEDKVYDQFYSTANGQRFKCYMALYEAMIQRWPELRYQGIEPMESIRHFIAEWLDMKESVLGRYRTGKMLR